MKTLHLVEKLLLSNERAINTGWIQREERRVRGFPPGESDVWRTLQKEGERRERGEVSRGSGVGMLEQKSCRVFSNVHTLR